MAFRCLLLRLLLRLFQSVEDGFGEHWLRHCLRHCVAAADVGVPTHLDEDGLGHDHRLVLLLIICHLVRAIRECIELRLELWLCIEAFLFKFGDE